MQVRSGVCFENQFIEVFIGMILSGETPLNHPFFCLPSPDDQDIP